ncbi:MAG: cytochrome b/b6 domain-containing protein [Candidatus Thiodiazotropha sp. (ex Epidulcina cf. delphinae)]|nr:cytochrome b/b6 domain-containing protein [Candidatus Thiodiazotropha sp. (ex Epidulcina cf. delphinae)]
MSEERKFVRLTKSQRIQHAVLFISTGLLILTGFMLQGERWVIEMFGTAGDTIFWWRSLIHRIAGVAVTIICLYHILHVAFTKEGRSWIKDMLPGWRDLTDVYRNIGYMLGLREQRPKMDRFTYLEKLEYFSVWFGMFIVILTGIMMWTEYLWPKFYLDVAGAFHLGEATLAALAVIVGHVFAVHYNPHVYPMNRAFIDGYIKEGLMKEEHPLWHEREVAQKSGDNV